MITDSFPRGRRALAVSIYVSALSVGGGLALLGGGVIAEHWSRWSAGLGPLANLKGWQAAFMISGVPGLILAFFAWRMPEPVRGGMDPVAGSRKRVHLADFASELAAVLPPFTFGHMLRHGGWRSLRLNLTISMVIAAISVAAALLLHDWPQFLALGLGLYSMISWHQSIALRDPALFALMLGSRAFAFTFGSATLVTCINGGVAFWAIPYAIRTFALPAGNAGLLFGSLLAGSSIAGMLTGGALCDRWSRRDGRAPAWLILVGLLLPMPFAWLMFLSNRLELFVLGYLVFGFSSYAWTGAWAAFAQELVLPRMRGTVSSAISLGSILISLAVGPYMAGRVGMLTGSLATGVLSLYLLAPPALILLFFAIRLLPKAMRTMLDRARAAGENC